MLYGKQGTYPHAIIVLPATPFMERLSIFSIICGGTFKCSAMCVAVVRLRSWSVQLWTFDKLSNALLGLLHAVYVACEVRHEIFWAKDNERSVSGIVCSFLFFVCCACHVMVLSKPLGNVFAYAWWGVEFAFALVAVECSAEWLTKHKCIFAISPRLWPVRTNSFTISPKVPNCELLIHTFFNSSKVRTRSQLPFLRGGWGEGWEV